MKIKVTYISDKTGYFYIIFSFIHDLFDDILLFPVYFKGVLCNFCRHIAIHEGYGRTKIRRRRHYGIYLSRIKACLLL